MAYKNVVLWMVFISALPFCIADTPFRPANRGKDQLGRPFPRDIGPMKGRSAGIGLDHAYPSGTRKTIPFIGPLLKGHSRLPRPKARVQTQPATHSTTVMFTPRRVADPNDPLGPGEFTSDDGKIYVYSMDDLVGGGNFARVFKARNKENPSEIIAVKRHLFTLGMGDEEGALKLLGRFLGANPEGSLIGMPFHQGKTLAWHLKEGNLSPAQRSHLYSLVSDKVSAFHELGWVHRDLKPENIMVLDEMKEVELLDFSLSEDVSSFPERKRKNFYNLDHERVRKEFLGIGIGASQDQVEVRPFKMRTKDEL